MIFEPIRPEALESLYAVECQAHAYPWSRKTLASCLEAPYWGESVVGAEACVVGFFLFQQILDEVTLMNICVRPSGQGRGIGRAMLERGLRQARARGANHCFLEVRAGNTAAIGLYRALGFVEAGRRKGYYPAQDGREDAVLMSLALGES